MLPKFSQIVNQLYAFIYETNHSMSGLGLPSIVGLGEQNSQLIIQNFSCSQKIILDCFFTSAFRLGAYSLGDTPVPIPNTAVKPARANGTWG